MGGFAVVVVCAVIGLRYDRLSCALRMKARATMQAEVECVPFTVIMALRTLATRGEQLC